MTLDDSPPPKKRHRIRLLLLLVVVFSVWRLVQRTGSAAAGSSWNPDPQTETEEPMTETPPNLNPPVTSPPVTSPPVTSLRIRSAGQSSDEGALHLKMSDPRYAVKWVDCTDGAEARHEKRDLTLKQAQREAGWLARHNRRFYPGDLAARSPFARLQVWLQCACGRDVIESREPHTLPGEDRICPYSGSDASRPADVMVASR